MTPPLRTGLVAASLLLLSSTALWATPFPAISMDVGVCDPSYPNTRCLVINSDGSINTVISGGGGGAVTIADGADVGEGATSASAATPGSTGSLNAKLRLMTTQFDTNNTNIGAPGSTACATDTGSCNENALLQRIAQRVTSLISALGSPFQAGGTIPLPSGASTATLQPSNSAQGATTSGQTGNLSMCAALTSAPTYTTAQTNPVQCDTHGSLPIVQRDGNGANVDPTLPVQTYSSNSFAHISTSTTTVVKSGTGALHTITVNGLGTVASSTIVYDNTAGSGTVIAVINTLAGQESYVYDVTFATGLTLVTTGTVAPDITVSYR